MDSSVTNFKIVSVGWSCADWLERTLRSVESQTIDTWDIWITYDPSDDDGADKIRAWCDERDSRWHYTINDTHKWAVRNQYEALQNLDVQDEDVVVFLDLDGDQLAHPKVLKHLAEHYSDGTLLTYGSYEPVPYAATCTPACPFPQNVVKQGSYRTHMLTSGCCFNHLRTMSGKVFNRIPLEEFKWNSGPQAGQWYVAGTDYVFMVAGLELAGGKYKCLDEVLLLYNHANPKADYLTHPSDADACTQNYLRRPPLSPIRD